MIVTDKVSIKSVRFCIFASYTANENELAQMKQELELTLAHLGLKPDVLNCTTGSTEVLIEFLSFVSKQLVAGALAATGGLLFNYFRKKFKHSRKKGQIGTNNIVAPVFKSYANPLARQTSSSENAYERIKSDFQDRFSSELTDLEKFEHLSALTSVGQKSSRARARCFIEYEDEDGNIRVESWSMDINNGRLTEISKNVSLEFPEV